MEAERWQRLETLYREAAGIEPAQRLSFLTVACAGDEELLRDVQSLLKYATSAESFMEAPAVDIVAKLMDDEITPIDTEAAADASPAWPDLQGQRFGNFIIRRRLGGGGMG